MMAQHTFKRRSGDALCRTFWPRRRLRKTLTSLTLVLALLPHYPTWGQDRQVMHQSAVKAPAEAQGQNGLVVTDLTANTPADLVRTLLGDGASGVSVSNIKYTGTADSAGFFTGGTGIIGFESGIILSTGSVRNVIGPNQFPDISKDNGLPGDGQLNELIPGLTTFDATSLEFDFVPKGDVISFQYVFASEEYNEFVYSVFNDVFGFFLNGKNVALLPGTNTPVTINNVNGGHPFGTNPTNPQFYINNDLEDGGAVLNTEMDGLTVVLSVQAPVKAGQLNHIKLAIADASDHVLDSNVFIKAASFVDQPPRTSDLALTQTVASGAGADSSGLTYTITVSNNGPDPADSFTIIDNLPAGTSFISCAASGGGTCGGTGNNRTVTFASLPVGGSAVVTLAATAACAGGGSPNVSNTARVISSTFDPNQDNNSATTTVTAGGAAQGQLALDGGQSGLEFGPVVAGAEPSQGSPSKTFSVVNIGCGPLLLSFAITRTGSDAANGRITNPDDSAFFPLRLINANGSETPLAIGPGASPVSIAVGQKQSFRVLFSPLIPVLAGRTTEVSANQVLPELVTSRLSITPNGGAPLAIGLAGRVATAVKLIHPLDPRRPPLVTLAKSGDEFQVECSVFDPNLDLSTARYQFLDSAGRSVGVASDVALESPIAERGLIKGQSFTIIQKFSGALRRPEITNVRVTVIDREASDTAVSGAVGAAEASVVSVSAASFGETALASESIVAAFGQGLAATTQAAATTPLPTTLAGTRVLVRDGAGVERLAPLFFVSPGQINYQLPAGTMPGAATITVTRGAGVAATGAVQVAATAPGLFAANADGQGAAAAIALRVRADGTQSFEPLALFDPAQHRFIPRPLDLGAETDRVYLVLFGTGLRYRRSLSTTSVKIGGVEAQTIYAGAQGGFVGLDQLNVLVPRRMPRGGEVDVTLRVEGRAANPVKINIRGGSGMTANSALAADSEFTRPAGVRSSPGAAVVLPTIKLPEP